MITFMLVFFAIVEIVKITSVESYTRWIIRLRKNKTPGDMAKASMGYPVQPNELTSIDAIASLIMLPIALSYLFVCLWVLIFGNNIYAQAGGAINFLCSFLVSFLSKRVKLESFKLRVTINLLDGFIGVILCCAMAYFYQRPM